MDGLYSKLGEYENLDELNYLASKLDEMDQSDYAKSVSYTHLDVYKRQCVIGSASMRLALLIIFF